MPSTGAGTGAMQLRRLADGAVMIRFAQPVAPLTPLAPIIERVMAAVHDASHTKEPRRG